MFQKILMFFFATKTALVTCNYEARTIGIEKERVEIKKYGKLDPKLDESSGLCRSPWTQNYLTINDSGGKPELYEIDSSGKLLQTIPVPGTKNVDWEEITTDNKGNVFIGDFGNNSNRRKDLTIYRFNGQNTQKITFSYMDQVGNAKLEYDCEAFFWHNDSLYLFTKSWEKGVKTSRLYSLPDTPGHYDLEPKGEIRLKAQITGAAIDPLSKKFVLMTYGKILFFGIDKETIDFSKPLVCLNIAKKQTEAITFTTPSKLLFTNEQLGIFGFEI